MSQHLAAISRTNSALLDIIRFLASQGVVIGHCFGFMDIVPTGFSGMASYCVLVFFVLSGFLISYSLWSKLELDSEYSFWSFFQDRFFRIYPPFIGALLLVLVLDFSSFLITGNDYSASMYVKNFVINLFQLQGFPIANILYHQYGIELFYFRHLGSNFPLWTISIEWWLYMFYGFCIFYILRKRTHKFKHWLVFVFLLITPIYYVFFSTRLDKGLTLYWFLGTLITLAMYHGSQKYGSQRIVRILSISLICMGLLGFSLLGYNTAILLFFIGLFYLMVYGNEPQSESFSFLERLSKTLASYSYSLYLVHYPIMVFAVEVFKPEKNLGNFFLLIIVCNVIAFLFARIFERRSKHLKLLYENYRRNKN